jgi:hypothetical protein
VDGTQKSFEENVVPRQNKKKAILTAFSKRFKSVPDSVKESHHAKLAADLAEPILVAITESTRKAEERVYAVKNVALANRNLPEINNNSSSFTITADAGFISQYLRTICNLETACVDIYEPVKQKYLNICLEIYKSFTEILDFVKALEEENLDKINSYTNELLEKHVEKSTEKIRALPATCLLQKDDDIVRQLFAETISEHLKTSEQMYKRYKITGNLSQNSMAKFYWEKIGDLKGTAALESYDHTKVCCSRFTNALKKLNDTLWDVVVEYKKSLLLGKYVYKSQTKNLLIINPKIDFINSEIVDKTILGSDPAYMTLETYEKMYVPILKTSIESLIEKGYTVENLISFHKSTTENLSRYDFDLTSNNYSDGYYNTLNDILERKFQKMFCKEVVKGTQFAEEFMPA